MQLGKNIRNIAILLAVIGLGALASIAVSNRLKSQIGDEFSSGFDIKTRPSWVGQYLSGYHATQQKDYKRASEYFVTSLNARSNSEVLQTQAMSLLLVSGKFSEAVEIAKDLNKKSDNGLARLTLIVDAVQKNNLGEAERLVVTGKDESGTIINHIIHAWVKLGMGKKQEAMQILDGLQGDEVFLTFVNYNYAMIADLSGNKEKATELYDKITEAGQLPVSITTAAYEFYKHTGNKEKMKLVAEKFNHDGNPDKHPPVTNVKEGVAESLMGVGGIIMTQYSPDKSAALFRLALYLNPKLDDAKILLGSILMNEGDYKGANEILNSVSKESYLGDYAKLAIAKNYESMEQNAKARDYFESLTSNAGTAIDAYVSLGDLARKDEDFAKAAKYYTSAIEVAHTEAKNGKIENKYWAVYFARGVCYERMKEWEKAESDLQTALKLQPSQPDVMNYLAYTWIDMGKNLDQAKEMVLKAHEEKPEDPQIIDSVGWAFFRLGDYEAAVEYLEAAASMLPYDPVVNDHLGDAYWKTNRKNEAKFQWNRALKNDPEPKLAEEIKQKLEGGLLNLAKDENLQKSAQ